MSCGHVCARLQAQIIRVDASVEYFLAYRSFPPVALMPIIGTLMNLFALLVCSNPVHLNNPRHEAKKMSGKRLPGVNNGNAYSSRRQHPIELTASGK